MSKYIPALIADNPGLVLVFVATALLVCVVWYAVILDRETRS
jgi:hypothetical protein